jgi:hypothetical protein
MLTCRGSSHSGQTFQCNVLEVPLDTTFTNQVGEQDMPCLQLLARHGLELYPTMLMGLDIVHSMGL